jgi:ankyrin repeat protein
MARNVDIARCLLEHKADVHRTSFDDLTPLHTAKDVATIELLSEHNADVNAVISDSGNTRLHSESDPAIIQCLVKKGADISIQNKEGCTALHTAVMDSSVTQSLLESIVSLYCGCNANKGM